MTLSVRTALFAGLVAGLVPAAPACTPEDDPHPPYVAAHSAVTTDRGLYILELSPAEGRVWPRFPGPTALAIHVEVGPDPAPYDPKFNTHELPTPPLTLIAGPARPEDAGRADETDARPWPLSDDGSSWRLGLEFTAPGDWSVPVTIRDQHGHADEVELVFRIERRPK